jgi:S1-C subfamily serine protease
MENRRNRYLGTLLIVAAAIAAGAAGAAVVVSSAVSLFSPSPESVQPSSRPVARANATKVTEAARSAVSFYRVRAGSGLDAVPLPADLAGNGVVVTADGWLLTSAALAQSKEQLLVVFSDLSSALIDKTKAVRDDATGLAFLRAPESHLIAAAFGSDRSVQPGDPAYLPEVAGVGAAAIVSGRELPVSGKSDYIESSEKLGRRLRLSAAGAPGTAVVNGSGEVIAIAVGDGTAVPVEFVSGRFRDVFKDGAVVRPKAGLRYVSTDRLPAGRAAGFLTGGALIAGGGKYAAVAKGSAAEAAGLKEGDVILAVEHDRVNGGDSFAEMIQDYAPGAEVELSVSRAGKEIKIKLILK